MNLSSRHCSVYNENGYDLPKLSFLHLIHICYWHLERMFVKKKSTSGRFSASICMSSTDKLITTNCRFWTQSNDFPINNSINWKGLNNNDEILYWLIIVVFHCGCDTSSTHAFNRNRKNFPSIDAVILANVSGLPKFSVSVLIVVNLMPHRFHAIHSIQYNNFRSTNVVDWKSFSSLSHTLHFDTITCRLLSSRLFFSFFKTQMAW